MSGPVGGVSGPVGGCLVRWGVWSRGGGCLQFWGGGSNLGGCPNFWGVSNFFGGGGLPEYGQRSAGTHPTGMHFCLTYFSFISLAKKNLE